MVLGVHLYGLSSPLAVSGFYTFHQERWMNISIGISLFQLKN